MPPAVNELDHQIGTHNGSTSVLEISPQRVQVAKRHPAPDLTTRLEEVTREVGQMRPEILFYRQCFEILHRLRSDCYDVYHQAFLTHYLDQDPARLGDLMTQLQGALEQSARLEAEAKRAWLDFWGVDLKGHDKGPWDDDDGEQGNGNWI
jgi:hypothetical protein